MSQLNLDELTKQELDFLFQKQSEAVKKANSATNDDKLYLYKYYKQATVGNINIEEPGFFDFTGKAKYNAWKSVEDTSTTVSMKKYILKTNELLKI
jgi:acyl-CoA-binding protein